MRKLTTEECMSVWTKVPREGLMYAITPLMDKMLQVNAEEAKDAARLNFLIEHWAYVVSDDTCANGYWLRYVSPGGSTWVQSGEYATPRAAIDAAMKGTP